MNPLIEELFKQLLEFIEQSSCDAAEVRQIVKFLDLLELAIKADARPTGSIPRMPQDQLGYRTGTPMPVEAPIVTLYACSPLDGTGTSPWKGTLTTGCCDSACDMEIAPNTPPGVITTQRRGVAKKDKK
jgi:hypothetical protein